MEAGAEGLTGKKIAPGCLGAVRIKRRSLGTKAGLGIVIAFMTIAALALAACGPAASGGQPAVEGTPWKLASYVNAESKTRDELVQPSE